MGVAQTPVVAMRLLDDHHFEVPRQALDLLPKVEADERREIPRVNRKKSSVGLVRLLMGGRDTYGRAQSGVPKRACVRGFRTHIVLPAQAGDRYVLCGFSVWSRRRRHDRVMLERFVARAIVTRACAEDALTAIGLALSAERALFG